MGLGYIGGYIGIMGKRMETTMCGLTSQEMAIVAIPKWFFCFELINGML